MWASMCVFSGSHCLLAKIFPMSQIVRHLFNFPPHIMNAWSAWTEGLWMRMETLREDTNYKGWRKIPSQPLSPSYSYSIFCYVFILFILTSFYFHNLFHCFLFCFFCVYTVLWPVKNYMSVWMLLFKEFTIQQFSICYWGTKHKVGLQLRYCI